MKKRPLNLFGYRDFTLALLEIGLEAESGPLPYLDDCKLERPYFVGKRENGKIGLYIDTEQVEWQKNELLSKIKTDPEYDIWLLKMVEEKYSKIEAAFKENRALTRDEFKVFVGDIRISWRWYAGLWWEIEVLEQKKMFPEKMDKSMAFRTRTHEFIPIADNICRQTIKKLYPKTAEYADFIRFGEAIKDEVPSIAELKKRKDTYLYMDNSVYLGSDMQSQLEKNNVELVIPKAKDHQIDGGDIKGQIAFKGKYCGKVSIVFTKEEANKFVEGNVLVSSSTIPDFVYAIERAGAIITDEGGIMSHAAILSRELKKPCIIGTKIATQALKNGDMVEVDAEKGVVRILK